MATKAATKRKGSKAPTGTKPAKKKQKETESATSAPKDAVGTATEIYFLEKDDGKRTFVMNEEAFTAHLMSGAGWHACDPQCKNVKEAMAWMKAGAEKAKPQSEGTAMPSGIASINESKEGDDVDDDIEEDEGRDVNMDDVFGDGLLYKSNEQRLEDLGLTNTISDMKAAAVTAPKSKRKSIKTKKVPSTEERRSTRAVLTDTSPNYAEDFTTEDSEEEEVENGEDKDEEESEEDQ